MKNIFCIAKKELDKIFKYPRMIFTLIVIPGVLIFLVYSIMGNSANESNRINSERINEILLVDQSEDFENYVRDTKIINEYNIKIQIWQASDSPSDEEKDFHIKDYKNSLRKGDISAVLVFSGANDVKVYSDLSLSENSGIEDKIERLLLNYKIEKKNVDLFNFSGVINTNSRSSNAIAVASLIPFLVIVFIFSGALSIGADAIAGEKERGTLSTILVTPIKKSEFIVGKMVSTTLLAVLSAISSFIGLVISMSTTNMFGDIDLSYGFGGYLLLFIVVLSIALLSMSLILMASTFAKTIKEATMLSIPLYVIAMITGVIGFYNTHAPSSISYYFIPIYNVNICIKSILMYDVSAANVSATIISTLFYSIIIFRLILRMFKSEEILFGN